MRRVAKTAVLAAVGLVGCGPVELRIDETRGVPTLKGTTSVTIDASFTCGADLPAGGKTVHTRAVTGGCEFSFDDTVQVLSASDYQSIGELKTAANLVQRVELDIKQLDFVDGTSGAKLDLATRVTSATLSVNGQQVADKATLAALPAVVTLSGDALAAVKQKVDARAPVAVDVKAVAVLPTTPAPPQKLDITYDAQPAIIIGPGTIKLF
jgi:hypothetical protein